MKRRRWTCSQLVGGLFAASRQWNHKLIAVGYPPQVRRLPPLEGRGIIIASEWL